MKTFHLYFLAVLLLLSGCSILPSGWRIFGTPLDKEAKKVEQETSARKDVLNGAQEAVHKASEALAAAPDSRPVDVARDFVGEAKALMDQAQGAPAAGDAAKWRDLVARLLSEDAAVRATAEAERKSDAARIASISDKLVEATTARERAEAQVRQYAKDNERLADWVRKALWLVGLILGFWLLGQILAQLAKVNPALAGVSAAVNWVAAPVAQGALSKAKAIATSGLQKVGAAMAEIRTKLPQYAEQVETIFDKHADEAHKQIIGPAAVAAGKGPDA